ncbi:hypothetical protein BBJ29_000067 [Phytophthora kernoviae]|uniref:Uncharacterized protein n=1 Tax=Phytophthora kernoviae TaxID=325452 RepID=A0A3F2S2H1_9STRA|nr:hypothetical protein BBJ29_000067 [Phytophthora kernoviae]RLN68968.1 hypothetical protein BBP00_00000686 [Phytophthora kernoviae]
MRELVLNCKSKWDLDEEIASTGGAHFEMGSEYPETLSLLRNFMLTKIREEESKQASKYYSVVNDAPYVSHHERETIEKQVRSFVTLRARSTRLTEFVF